MDKITAEKNFNLIEKHPKGNFYVDKEGKIIEIAKWNLIGRIIQHYKNRNGGIDRKVNKTIVETLNVVNKEPIQKLAVLSKIEKCRGIPVQLLDERIQKTAVSELLEAQVSKKTDDKIVKSFQAFIKEHELEILPFYQEHEMHFDQGQIHGRMHATRVVLFAELMGRYLASKGQKVDFDLLRRTAGLHDAGREANGEDFWEEKSANILKQHLIRKRMPEDLAELKSKAIIKGQENKPSSIESLLFSSADCVDIMRPCTGRGGRKGFDQNYLLFLKEGKPGSDDAKFRAAFIEEAWLFIQETEKMKGSLKTVENSGYLPRLLEVIKAGKEKYPILSSLV